MPTLVGPAVTLESWQRHGQPTLAADGLELRPWAAGDVDAVVRAYSDPAIQRWHVQRKTPDEARHWIDDWPRRFAAGTGADWATTENGAVVGRIGLRSVDLFEGEAEIAYWVLPEARGRQVAPRALVALTAWLFDATGVHRVAVRHSTRNEASCRVAERAGYAFEGTMRRAGRHADGDHDMHLHAALRPDGAEPPAGWAAR